MQAVLHKIKLIEKYHLTLKNKNPTKALSTQRINIKPGGLYGFVGKEINKTKIPQRHGEHKTLLKNNFVRFVALWEKWFKMEGHQRLSLH
ncbi:MAG TPA: hypothetical protein VHL77_03145 [Ferruginibacter sp.]|jgi:hypothetical protein|nr:hypothetical protein [Ferruginibacter sp.]